jgi:hypothetical protein
LAWAEMIFGTAIGNYSQLDKPVFPFPEESHFALAFGPICIGLLLSNLAKIFRFFILVNIFVLAVLFPSATLFSYLMLAMAIIFIQGSGMIKLLLVGLAMSSALALYMINVDSAGKFVTYYFSRILFWNSNNLSALVYLQGWSDAARGVYENFGFGLGFQRMGTNAPSEISNSIYALVGEYKNRMDGSFLVSKLVSELGFAGILIIFLYILFLYKFYIFVIKFGTQKDKILYGVYASFLVELFVRGYGYFSPGIILVSFSWIYLSQAVYFQKSIARHQLF